MQGESASVDTWTIIYKNSKERMPTKMNIRDVLEHKREEILSIAHRNGAKDIRILGSVARGDATPDSDIDFLVEMESGRTLLDIIAIKQDLEDLLGCTVDVVTEAAVSPYIRDEVISQAVSL